MATPSASYSGGSCIATDSLSCSSTYASGEGHPLAMWNAPNVLCHREANDMLVSEKAPVSVWRLCPMSGRVRSMSQEFTQQEWIVEFS